jgi:predicted porin
MKKTHITLAALSVITGVAHAQSSVTLYGIIDDGLLYSSNANGKQLYSLSSSILQGSRWGLRERKTSAAG